MKWVVGLIALGLLGACAETNQTAAPAPVPVAERPVDPECKTVTVFSSTKITKPNRKIKPEWQAFSGVWGKAGWNDTWCHDLYVMKIEDTGKVILMDTHGPGGRHDGSAFQRTGTLTPDNRLVFKADGVDREYVIRDGKLYGVQRIAKDVELRIAMQRKS